MECGSLKLSDAIFLGGLTIGRILVLLDEIFGSLILDSVSVPDIVVQEPIKSEILDGSLTQGLRQVHYRVILSMQSVEFRHFQGGESGQKVVVTG